MGILLKYKRPLFLGILLISLLAGLFIRNIFPSDFNFEGFFPRDDEYAFFDNYRNIFSRDDNIIFVSFENPNGSIFDPGFLSKIESITGEIAGFANLDTFISPFQLKHITRSPSGTKEQFYFDYSDNKALDHSRKLLSENVEISSVFISKSQKHLGCLLVLAPEVADGKEKDVLIAEVENISKSAPGKVIISGIPYIRSKYVKKINSETGFFIGFSMFFIILVLAILYRKVWGILIPVVGVVLALVWSLGLLGFLGHRIDIMTNLVPTIILVVGIAGTIHLITHYVQEVKAGLSREDAMQATLKDIGIALFLTCLSTAIGFASLSISPQPPIRRLGLITAFGVMVTFLITVAFVPGLLLSLPKETISGHKGLEKHPIWDRLLIWINDFTKAKSTLILSILGALLLFSGIGISQLSYNTYLLDEIRKEDPVRQAMFFFEEEYNGIRPFEMAIIAKEGRNVTDIEIIREMGKIEDYLEDQAPFSPFFSLNTFLQNANRSYHYGRNKWRILPKNQEKSDELLGYAITSNQSEVLNQILSKDRKMARISARMPDLGTDKLEVLRKDIEAFISQNCNNDIFEYRLTGSSYMTERNVTNLRQSLFSSLALAFALIGILMGWLFKSWRMLLIALIPNMVPLLITAGLMGFIGLSLKSSTSIVFIISFGIAVDDTIHFLSRLNMEWNKSQDVELSIHNTLIGTGKALILTTMVLASGFFLFVTSDFGGTFTVGLFVLISLITGLLADLFLLPVLVRIALKSREK